MRKTIRWAVMGIARFIKKRVLRQPLRSERPGKMFVGAGGLPVKDAEWEDVLK